MNFDYSMADGVRKTFARLYRQNLARALTLLCGVQDPEGELKALAASLEQDAGLRPTLADCGAYFTAELPLLAPTGRRRTCAGPRPSPTGGRSRRPTGPPIRPWRP